MYAFGQVINLSLLLALAALSWVLPRLYGLWGMFGVQLGVGAGFLLMGFIALATGVWERYEDGLMIVGLLFQAVLFNCLLLPVAIVAIRAHGRQRHVASRAERGLCSHCGYDLRATPDRCPEWGTDCDAGVARK